MSILTKLIDAWDRLMEEDPDARAEKAICVRCRQDVLKKNTAAVSATRPRGNLVTLCQQCVWDLRGVDSINDGKSFYVPPVDAAVFSQVLSEMPIVSDTGRLVLDSINVDGTDYERTTSECLELELAPMAEDLARFWASRYGRPGDRNYWSAWEASGGRWVFTVEAEAHDGSSGWWRVVLLRTSIDRFKACKSRHFGPTGGGWIDP